jgi:hypothetical protein
MTTVILTTRAIEDAVVTDDAYEEPVSLDVKMPFGCTAVASATIDGVAVAADYAAANHLLHLWKAAAGTLAVARGDEIIATLTDATSFTLDTE